MKISEILFKCKVIILSLLLCAMCSKVYAIEKTIYLYVGESFTFSPWEDMKLEHPGFTCAMTEYSCDINSFSVNETNRVTTRYPTYNNMTATGFFCSYTAQALKTGTYTISGVASAFKKSGTTLYVTGYLTIVYHVVVSEKPKVLAITIPNELSLRVGDSYTFAPVVHEIGANTSLRWSSSNASVASISNGKILALSPGTTTITCTADNGVSTQCYVTVNPIYVTNIYLDRSEIELFEGEKYTLSTSITPLNATNKEVVWKTSNANVADVSSTGKIIAVSKGSCHIIASAKDGSGVSSDCLVIVKEKNEIAVESIALSAENLNLAVGESTSLIATIYPNNATNGRISWSSSDTNVAIVDEFGNVNAISNGCATIIATASGGSGVSATCQVIVTPILVKSITISSTTTSLEVGETIELKAIISPEDATDVILLWSSSNNLIATISETGVVKALSEGNVIITVSANDGKITASCTITITRKNDSNQLQYRFNKETMKATLVSGSKKYAGDIVIPSKVLYDGIEYTVTSIDDYCFYNCMELYSVVIPSTVLRIGMYSFAFSENLNNVILGNSMETIAEYAFIGCSSLANITLPNTLNEIGEWAFSGCSGLKRLIIPASVSSIGVHAFSGCEKLESVELPDGSSIISTEMFCNCSKLENVVIPSTVTKINDGAFYNCSKLQSVNFPKGLVSIGDNAFYQSDLTDVVLPEGLLSIGENAFYYNSLLSSISIPASVAYIGRNAFQYCYKLKSINIDSPVSLWSTGIEDLYVECLNIGDETVTVYDNLAACKNIKTLTLGTNVEYIRTKTFADALGLKEIICYAEIPPYCYPDVFQNVNKETCVLYVPKGCAEAYKAAEQWKDFASIVEKDLVHHLTYKLDNEVYAVKTYREGGVTKPIDVLEKEGYTFSGWSEIPASMPAEDVTVTGCFTINQYSISYKYNGVEIKTEKIDFGAEIPSYSYTPEETTDYTYSFEGWTLDGDNFTLTTMPSHDLVHEAKVTAICRHASKEQKQENVINPSCTTGGSYEDVEYCKLCEQEINRNKVDVPALGHIEGDVVNENIINPSCETNGSFDMVTYCTVCNEEVSRNTISVPALGHTMSESVVENVTEATCGNDGCYDNVIYCSVCEQEMSRETIVVPATGNHTPSEAVMENVVDPTETEKGSYDYVIYCSDCHKEISRETKETEPLSIISITSDPAVMGIYTFSGSPVTTPTKGTYIVRYKNGMTKKVFIK